tara:strand:- start:302 stop:877 length:576 start_codon:yes stop_codon:yes gene_type:complete
MRRRRFYDEGGIAASIQANNTETTPAQTTSAQALPDDYQSKMMAAYDKYGTDTALAYDPTTGEFAPGNVMLPTAEVSTDFVPKTKAEQDAYDNLGVEGALAMRDMQRGVTEGRNKFAKDYMVPVAEAVLNATSVGKGAQILGYGAKAAQSAGPLAKYFLKKAAKKGAQLGGKKYAQSGAPGLMESGSAGIT